MAEPTQTVEGKVRARGPRRRRRLIAALVFLVVLPEITYLIVGNVFLNSDWGRSVVNRRPEKLQVEWIDGYTLWPGRLVVRGLDMRGRSRRSLWSARVDEVSAQVSPFALMGRTVRVRGLRASEAEVVYVRRRGDGGPSDGGTSDGGTSDGGLNDGEQGDRPPVDEEAAVPGFAGRPEPAPPKPGRKPWHLRFHGFELEDVRRLWIDRVHWQADAEGGRARGTLTVDSRGGPFGLPKVDLELGPGRIRVAEERLAKVQELRFVGSLGAFVPKEHRGLSWLRFLTGHLDLRSSDGGLGLEDHLLRGSPLDLDARGDLEASLDTRNGVLLPGSELTIGSGDISVGYLGFGGWGEGGVGIRVDDGGGTEGPTATVEAHLEVFEVGRADTEVPHAIGQGLRLRATTPNLHLYAPGGDVVARVELPESEIPDITLYNAYLPPSSPLTLLGGVGRLRCRFDLATATNSLSGAVDLQGEGVRIGFEDRRFQGDLDLAVRMPRGRIDTRRLELDGTRLALTHLVAEGGDRADAEGWWAQVDIASGETLLSAPLELEARVEARVKDTAPLVALLEQRRPAVSWVRDLLVVENLELSSQLELQPRDIALRDAQLTAGRKLAISGQLRLAKPPHRGVLHLKYGRLQTAVELLPDGDRDWKLRRSRRWYEERSEAFWRGDDPAEEPPTP
ncbi:MAG: hypothetical protein AAGD06_26725 [Acidobacteriota bacterium]